MIRLCSQCKCELNTENAAKKDSARYRKICRSCYKQRRTEYRLLKEKQQQELISNLINKNVIQVGQINTKEMQFIKPLHKKEVNNGGILVHITNMVRNLIKEISNGL